jgi:hypothetical protein
MRTLRPQQFMMDARGRHLGRPAKQKGVGFAPDFIQHVQAVTGGSVPGQYVSEREPCTYYWHTPIQGGGGETLAEILCDWLSQYPGGVVGTPAPMYTTFFGAGEVYGNAEDAFCDEAFQGYQLGGTIYPNTPQGWASAYQETISVVTSNCGACPGPSIPQELGYYDPDGCMGSGTESTMIYCGNLLTC